VTDSPLQPNDHLSSFQLPAPLQYAERHIAWPGWILSSVQVFMLPALAGHFSKGFIYADSGFDVAETGMIYPTDE
jgi:hypothetical protein